MDRRRLAALTAALVLAVPGAAFAQSAGDEQYEDPFGGDQEQPEPTPEPTAAPDSSSDTGGETAQAAPAPAPTAPEATAAQAQLPRTGADAGLLALSGVVLLGSGLALRVRVRTG
jgi:LPXTG-motif cell wall-anchored protein